MLIGQFEAQWFRGAVTAADSTENVNRICHEEKTNLFVPKFRITESGTNFSWVDLRFYVTSGGADLSTMI